MVGKGKNVKKRPLTPEEKEQIMKSARPVKKLPDHKDAVKGQRFKLRKDVGKAAKKDGRAKNLGKTETVFERTGKDGFGAWKIVAGKKR